MKSREKEEKQKKKKVNAVIDTNGDVLGRELNVRGLSRGEPVTQDMNR